MFQVIHQFSDITTGDQSNVEYAEPAKTVNNLMAAFALDFLNFAPPECVDPDAGFYHKLFIMTSCPFLAPPLVYAYLKLVKHDPKSRHEQLRATTTHRHVGSRQEPKGYRREEQDDV